MENKLKWTITTAASLPPPSSSSLFFLSFFPVPWEKKKKIPFGLMTVLCDLPFQPVVHPPLFRLRLFFPPQKLRFFFFFPIFRANKARQNTFKKPARPLFTPPLSPSLFCFRPFSTFLFFPCGLFPSLLFPLCRLYAREGLPSFVIVWPRLRPRQKTKTKKHPTHVTWATCRLPAFWLRQNFCTCGQSQTLVNFIFCSFFSFFPPSSQKGKTTAQGVKTTNSKWQCNTLRVHVCHLFP